MLDFDSTRCHKTTVGMSPLRVGGASRQNMGFKFIGRLNSWRIVRAVAALLFGFKFRALAENQPQGCPAVILRHGGLEIGCGLVLGVGLAGAPFHAQTVAQTAKHAHDPQARRFADAATVIVLRNIQSLVQAIFDAPVDSIEMEPCLGVEFVGRGAGQQADFLVLAACRLAQQARGLGDQGKGRLFGRHGLGHNGAAFGAALVLFQRAALGGRRVLRGKNPLGERGLIF